MQGTLTEFFFFFLVRTPLLTEGQSTPNNRGFHHASYISYYYILLLYIITKLLIINYGEPSRPKPETELTSSQSSFYSMGTLLIRYLWIMIRH